MKLKARAKKECTNKSWNCEVVRALNNIAAKKDTTYKYNDTQSAVAYCNWNMRW